MIITVRFLLPRQEAITILAISLFRLAIGGDSGEPPHARMLTALGAAASRVGLFASLRTFSTAPISIQVAGWPTTGRRRALLTFTLIAIAGYALRDRADVADRLSWLVGVMAWKSGAFPTTFAVIGDSLPKNRRAVAFSVQSILIRLPRVIGAPLGGLLIVSAGMVGGIRTSVTITIGLALIVLVVQFFGFREEGPANPGAANASFRAVFAGMPARLTRLLMAECLIRIGEAVAASFIIRRHTRTRRLGSALTGALRHPAERLDRLGLRRPHT